MDVKTSGQEAVNVEINGMLPVTLKPFVVRECEKPRVIHNVVSYLIHIIDLGA